jgi:opacity protein-like surface antigen
MKRIAVALFLSCLVLAPAAWAGDFYIGASAGSASFDLPSQNNARVSFDDTGFKGFFGYRLTRFIAVEAAYTDFGDPSETVAGTDFESSVDVLALWAVGILPISPRLDLFARLGYTDWNTEVTIDDGINLPVTADNSGNDLGFGFGVSYNITPKWGLQLEWENYEFDDADDVNFTSLGVRFTF